MATNAINVNMVGFVSFSPHSPGALQIECFRTDLYNHLHLYLTGCETNSGLFCAFGKFVLVWWNIHLITAPEIHVSSYCILTSKLETKWCFRVVDTQNDSMASTVSRKK